MTVQAPETQISSTGVTAAAAAESPETSLQDSPNAADPAAAPPPPTSLFSYLRIFGAANPSWLDYLLILTGVLAAAAAGVPFPLMGIIFGQLVDDMNSATCAAEQSDPFAYEGAINDKVLQLVYIAIGAFCLIYIYVLSWSLVSQRLAQRLRARYIAALLRQPPAFFDARLAAGEVSSRLHGDMTAIQAGTSEKVGILIASTSFFVTAYIVAFIKEAKLAGMLISLIPAFLIMAFIGGFFMQKHGGAASDEIAAASSIASEALSHVTVVQAFGAAPKLEEKFAAHVAKARASGIKKSAAAAVQAGMLYFIAYSANALAFWQGSRMVVEAVLNPGSGSSVGQIYTVVFLLVDACVMLGSIAPILPLLGAAATSFQRIMQDIETPSDIDGTSDSGDILPADTPCAISFHNVSFSYPSRPGQTVLRNVDLTFPAGKHTAIVGLSGSGKSTIASLIGRLQDPTAGTITVDGRDIRELNVRNLRSFISLVQQEPSLLDRSILENIALGLINSPKPEHQPLRGAIHGSELGELAARGNDAVNPSIVAKYSPKVQQIVQLAQHAAEQADAAGFISRLDSGYGTFAGQKGSLVSGGQRQRIALARALIRDPKILVLDEATSALDSASEKRIQEAVERAAKDRTVISIAHRLSTIRNADNIVVMEAGEVVEQGTYDELMAKDGAFARMARLQTLGSAEKETGSGSSVSGESLDASTKEDGVPEKSETSGAIATEVSTRKVEGSIQAESEPEKDKMLDTIQPWSAVLSLLARLSRPSFKWLVVAIFAATIVGATFSGSGLIFGFTVGHLNPCDNTTDRILYYGQFFGGMLFMLAVIELLANFLAWASFGLIAERLLYAVRVLSFRSLLEQGVQWHQSEGRSPSSLLTIITKDSAAIGGFGGSTIGTVFSILVNFVVAIILSHIIAWKIALVCLVTVPILLGAGFMQLRMLARYEERHAEAHGRATAVAVEAVQAIRTVAALSLEEEVMSSYARLLRVTRDEMVKAAAFTNIWLALSNSTGFLIYAFAYWWGSQRIMHGDATQTQFFIILVAMLVSAQLWGQMFTLAPEFSRARTAMSRIMAVIHLGSDHNLSSPGDDNSKEKDPEAVSSSELSSRTDGMKITFSDVSFAYPARPDVPVLDHVSFTIHPGQFVGLVGPSGAGKSTIMALVQHLYTPTSGRITLDDADLTSLPPSFKDTIALVPQDPSLFSGSIRFNIALGARPGSEPTDAEVANACSLAGLGDVVSSLPEGYETDCGCGASRLSGGQRQRLAIARALIRKPRLLLLDESTSALDAASEAALQEGLERVMAQGTTVLAITHRLHTVRRADVIFVVEGGRVVDSGTHGELMARREEYRVNAMQQMLQ
ncbi:Leptomycin B resistance protein pmd1 [Echria macrotheca]|uniref:Leptomycin B resistance protein pmd1 n=1 Tax=Echria macrotheca TaxID=438768 RepID=A0AAJ0F2F5_9PEZI|nr:Leptomycin B resistance protein pmd1 [Echria macrotheca]